MRFLSNFVLAILFATTLGLSPDNLPSLEPDVIHLQDVGHPDTLQFNVDNPERSNSVEIVDDLIDHLEDENDFGSEVSKRIGVDFMGIHVSYPQYLRLIKLQEKVIKLKKMIEGLHQQYSEEQLNSLPQYKHLMQLHMTLMPLLPESMREPYDLIQNKNSSTYSVDFDGLRVSYPQYLRIKAIQEKISKLDQMMKLIADNYPREVLESIPRWTVLSATRKSLKKQIETLSAVQPQTEKRSTNTVDFNGMPVSYPQFKRLTKLQEKIQKFDNVLRKITEGRDLAMLAENQKWQELVSIRKSLQSLLPADYPSFDLGVSEASKHTSFGSKN